MSRVFGEPDWRKLLLAWCLVILMGSISFTGAVLLYEEKTAAEVIATYRRELDRQGAALERCGDATERVSDKYFDGIRRMCHSTADLEEICTRRMDR